MFSQAYACPYNTAANKKGVAAIMKKKLDAKALQAIKVIRESAGDASLGLPEEVFELASSIVPMINVDLLCQDSQDRILMIWRDDPICGCGWHIPGGIIRFKESIEERLLRTAENELGTRIQFDLEPIAVNQFVLPQNVRGHFISLLYRCYLSDQFLEFPAADPEKQYQPGDICWHSVCPQQWVKGQKDAYGKLFEPSQQVNRAVCTSIAEKVKAGVCTFVFDIDGVIAAFDPSLKYDRARPVEEIISIVNQLYNYGNRIVLFTARGSETGTDWSETTSAQMKDWGVKYHQLSFGKPAATFYVDDKNLSLNELRLLMKKLNYSNPRN